MHSLYEKLDFHGVLVANLGVQAIVMPSPDECPQRKISHWLMRLALLSDKLVNTPLNLRDEFPWIPRSQSFRSCSRVGRFFNCNSVYMVSDFLMSNILDHSPLLYVALERRWQKDQEAR